MYDNGKQRKDQRFNNMLRCKKMINDKLELELLDFKRNIVKLPPNEIVEKAYEIVFKEEISTRIGNGNMTVELFDLLNDLAFNNRSILNFIYSEWLRSDYVSLFEDYEDFICEISNYKSENK